VACALGRLSSSGRELNGYVVAKTGAIPHTSKTISNKDKNVICLEDCDAFSINVSFCRNLMCGVD
jgi:hypothetical protein